MLAIDALLTTYGASDLFGADAGSEQTLRRRLDEHR
jgi:hypothetical protein